MINQEKYIFFTNDNLKKFIENFLEENEEYYIICPFNIGSVTGGKWIYLCFTNKRIMKFSIESDSLSKFNKEYMVENPKDISNILDGISIKSYLNSEIENFKTTSDNFSTIVQFEYKNEELRFVHLESPEPLLRSLESYKNFNAH